MSAFVRAATTALIDQPVVNAVIDGNDLVYRDFVDISVAVATPSGLVVPVIRNCQERGFASIEKVIKTLIILTLYRKLLISLTKLGMERLN